MKVYKRIYWGPGPLKMKPSPRENGSFEDRKLGKNCFSIYLSLPPSPNGMRKKKSPCKGLLQVLSYSTWGFVFEEFVIYFQITHPNIRPMPQTMQVVYQNADTNSINRVQSVSPQGVPVQHNKIQYLPNMNKMYQQTYQTNSVNVRVFFKNNVHIIVQGLISIF